MLMISYLLLSLILFLLCYFKRWYLLCWLSYATFLISFLAIIPLPGQDEIKYTQPTQVVFRFDEHRYLQLTGYGCRGRLYYIDDQKLIYYELARHSAEVLTEPFAHMPEDYIFIPYEDYSAIQFSQDGGHSFDSIYIQDRDLNGDYRPNRETTESMVVLNNQFFLKDKNRGIFRSPKPYGTSSTVLSPANEKYLEYQINYMGERWSDASQTMPAIHNNYTGWHQWRCDPSLKQEITVYNRYNPLIQLQAKLRHLLGVTTKGDKA